MHRNIKTAFTADMDDIDGNGYALLNMKNYLPRPTLRSCLHLLIKQEHKLKKLCRGVNRAPAPLALRFTTRNWCKPPLPNPRNRHSCLCFSTDGLAVDIDWVGSPQSAGSRPCWREAILKHPRLPWSQS